jgi:hypothetical protein
MATALLFLQKKMRTVTANHHGPPACAVHYYYSRDKEAGCNIIAMHGIGMQHCMHLGNPAQADARASRVLGRRKDPLTALPNELTA